MEFDPSYFALIIVILIPLLHSLLKRKQPKFATYGSNVAQSILASHDIKTVETKPTAASFYEKQGTDWVCTTWESFFSQASRIASFLVNDLHLPRGSRICILGPTRSKWVICDMGVMLSGCVAVGIYPSQTSQQYEYIIKNCSADVVFVDGKEELKRILAATEGMPNLKAIVVWDDALVGQVTDRDGLVVGWSSTQTKELAPATLQERIKLIHHDDLAVLVYTSGTTGPPKGVMLSHTNILALARGIMNSAGMREDDLSFNFLPLSHVAERFLGFYARIDKGTVNCFASSFGQVIPELQEVTPTVFGAVPRIFEKAHAKVYSDLAKKPKLIQAIFHWATGVAKKRNDLLFSEKPIPLLMRIQYYVAYEVFRPVRQAFGGRVRQMMVGAAPIDKKLLEFFWGCGLRVYEVYGLTEVTAVCFTNRPGCFKLGTVGKIVKSAECKIAEDGEILVRAPFVFLGYFNDPESTREVKDEDGWLHTGDIGKLDEEGFMTITDRKKHLIITSGGKNLSPANIEKAIRNVDPIISQVHAHGDKRPFVVCIVTPSPIETLECGVANNLIPRSTYERLVKELMNNPFARSDELNQATAKVISHPSFVSRVRSAVDIGNQTLSHVEKVKKYFILDRDFSQEQEIEKKFQTSFDKLYEIDSFGYNVDQGGKHAE